MRQRRGRKNDRLLCDGANHNYNVRLPLLKQGMEDAAGIAVQQLLAARGYCSGDCDGQFGELTKQAVMSFQADNGLETDGEVGGQTWSKLLRG